MAKFGLGLYFRVAFFAFLLPLASGELRIICNMCSRKDKFCLGAFVIVNEFIECSLVNVFVECSFYCELNLCKISISFVCCSRLPDSIV